MNKYEKVVYKVGYQIINYNGDNDIEYPCNMSFVVTGVCTKSNEMLSISLKDQYLVETVLDLQEYGYEFASGFRTYYKEKHSLDDVRIYCSVIKGKE